MIDDCLMMPCIGHLLSIICLACFLLVSRSSSVLYSLWNSLITIPISAPDNVFLLSRLLAFSRPSITCDRDSNMPADDDDCESSNRLTFCFIVGVLLQWYAVFLGRGSGLAFNVRGEGDFIKRFGLVVIEMSPDLVKVLCLTLDVSAWLFFVLLLPVAFSFLFILNSFISESNWLVVCFLRWSRSTSWRWSSFKSSKTNSLQFESNPTW